MDLDDFDDGERYLQASDLHDLLEDATGERQWRVDAVDEVDDESPGAELERKDLEHEVALWDAEYGDALKRLEEVCDELPNSTLLIHEEAMEDYLDDEVQQCYDLPTNLPSFITITIDYDALKADYSTVDIGEHTYYWRD